ncbi:MAG TPA: hypothetical protein VF427_09325 [Noviherbaspirillum sp.]
MREPTNAPISVRLLEAPQPQSPPQASTPAAGNTPRPRRSLPTPAIIAKSHRPPAAAAKPGQPKHQAKVTPAPAMDMMDMLNAARERRRAEQNSTPENVQVSAQESNDIALANINRDLLRQSGKWRGIGGVFQIISKGTRTAQFQFRGWNSGSNNSWRQTIDVDAGLNGDVELAIVQKMIALIRTHYSGDFNWESHRLGKVVVLSARPSDNAELEAFLMQEFFGS